jgi:hypothetical protein
MSDRGREQLRYAACRLQDANVDIWILTVLIWFVVHSLAALLEPYGDETLCGTVSVLGARSTRLICSAVLEIVRKCRLQISTA